MLISLCSVAKRGIEISSVVTFGNTFVLIRDSGLCLFVKKSLQRINPSFCSNQLYKTLRLIADYFLSRNKIKFRHSFISAQVFGLPSSTGPLGFPNKVCDTYIDLQGVYKLSLQFSKFVKILFFEVFLFDLFYSEEKCFKFFLS